MSTAIAVPSTAWPAPNTGSWARLPFDPPRVLGETLLLCGLFMLNKAEDPGAVVFFLVLFIMAARSTAGAFKALMLVGLGVMLNQWFVPKSLVWTPTRLTLSLFCALRCFVDVFAGSQRVRVPGYFYALLAFCIASAVCSILSGYYVTIALLKLANFFTVTSATLLAIEAIRRRRLDLGPWFVALIGTIVVFGLASIVLGESRNFLRYRAMIPGVARETLLFNGAFLHPNCHSSLAAPAFVFLLSAAVYSTYRNRWMCVAMAAVVAVFMALSQARTAIVASAVGVLVVVAFARPGRFVRGWRPRINLRRGTLVALLAIGGAGLFVTDVATGGSIGRRLISFANKSANAEELDTDDMLSSRQGKIELSWKNFLESPIYGIGFQVSTEEYFKRSATLFTAPSEKGFLYSAVLEEGGLIGATTFAIFLISFLFSLVRSRNVPGLAVFMTSLVASTFEVSLFAMGGAGTYFWTLTGAAIMLGDHCWDPAEPARGSRLA